MLALIEADALGQIRTGAASGVATRFLAREDAHTLGVIGTGWQARTQLEAFLHVRDLARARVRPRRRAPRAFCEEMAESGRAGRAGRERRGKPSGADVVCTMTSASTPVLEGAWLRPGTHVNAAGSNRANAQEIDVETVRRAACRRRGPRAGEGESGDLRAANETGDWRGTRTRLSDLVGGTRRAAPASSDHALRVARHRPVGSRRRGPRYDACVAKGAARACRSRADFSVT